MAITEYGEVTEELLDSLMSDTWLWLKATGVDAVAAANASLGTIPTGKTFVPLLAFVLSTAKSGTISVPPVISIGTNSSSFNNMIAAITTTGLTANNLVFPFPVASVAGVALEGTEVIAKFTTPASGVTPGLTVSIFLGGVYI